MNDAPARRGARPKFKCVLCGRPKVRGTFIRHGFLCARCESILSVADAEDPNYDRYIRRLRALWPDASQLRLESPEE